MNSDTPRTDIEESNQTQRFGCRMVKSDFARQLERENNRLHSELENIANAKPYTLSEEYDEFELTESLRLTIKHLEDRNFELYLALKDAISTYDPRRESTLVTEERQEAWNNALHRRKNQHNDTK
jgi:hypothetical protein